GRRARNRQAAWGGCAACAFHPAQRAIREGWNRLWPGESVSRIRFFLCLDVDRLAVLGSALLRDGLGLLGVSLLVGVTHAFLESLDGPAQVFAHIAQFLGA